MGLLFLDRHRENARLAPSTPMHVFPGLFRIPLHNWGKRSVGEPRYNFRACLVIEQCIGWVPMRTCIFEPPIPSLLAPLHPLLYFPDGTFRHGHCRETSCFRLLIQDRSARESGFIGPSPYATHSKPLPLQDAQRFIFGSVHSLSEWKTSTPVRNGRDAI